MLDAQCTRNLLATKRFAKEGNLKLLNDSLPYTSEARLCAVWRTLFVTNGLQPNNLPGMPKACEDQRHILKSSRWLTDSSILELESSMNDIVNLATGT